MYKVIWMCRFKQGLDLDEARKHWLEVHGALALKVPALLGYVQSHRVGEIEGLGDGAESRSFDGYSAGWFDSREAYEAALATPEWDALRDDGAELFEGDSMLVASFEEHVLRPVPGS